MHDILFVGNFTRDTVISPAGTHVIPGGGAIYGAHAAVVLGVDVAVVTRIADEDRASIDDLASRGVTIHMAVTGQSTALTIRFPTGDPDERVILVTSSAGSIDPDQIEGIDARTIVFSPSFSGEIPSSTISVAKQRGCIVALDVQGFIRNVSKGHLFHEPWDDRKRVLPLVSILKTDSVEAHILTGESDPLEAAKRLQEEGASEVLVTDASGALLFDGRRSYQVPFVADPAPGRSGRGDTCLGAYSAARMTMPPAEALAWAAATTSCKLLSPGPFRGSAHDVEAFIRSTYRPYLRGLPKTRRRKRA